MLVLIDSSWYLSKTTSILWYLDPILNTVVVKIFAKSPYVFIPWVVPLINKQVSSVIFEFAGVSTSCVSMFAIISLLLGCHLLTPETMGCHNPMLENIREFYLTFCSISSYKPLKNVFVYLNGVQLSLCNFLNFIQRCKCFSCIIFNGILKFQV